MKDLTRHCSKVTLLMCRGKGRATNPTFSSSLALFTASVEPWNNGRKQRSGKISSGKISDTEVYRSQIQSCNTESLGDNSTNNLKYESTFKKV